MARSLWKGAISFGLVNIPVELFPAEERKGFAFSMLDKRDLSPVGYKRYSKKSGKEVQWADIVKGYEYEKDQYVVLSDEDFRRANVKGDRTRRRRAGRHSHDRASGGRRSPGSRLDAGHDAPCRRDPRRQRLRAAGRRIEERRRQQQGRRSRQAPGRRHDRALEAGGVQGHLSRRPDAPHPREDQGRRNQGDRQAN